MPAATREHATPVWSTRAWLDHAVAWADDALAAAGLRRTGPAEQVRLRAWSTVVRIPVDGAASGASTAVWLKAPAASAVHEVSLAGVLARHVPDAVLHPLATDPDRGLLLMPDGGPVLREIVGADRLIDAWVDVVRVYSQLQRRLADAVPDLLAAGVPSLPPSALAGQAEAVIRRWDGPASGRDRVVAACTRLAASPVPASIQHDDLHTGNVFLDRAARDRALFFDWGDAYVGHPFASVLIAVRCLAHQHGYVPGAGELRRLRDAYLEPWLDLGDRAGLDRDLDDALVVARLGRVLGWERSLAHATGDEFAEWSGHPRAWAAELAGRD